MHEIKSFKIFQTAKVIGVLYAIIFAIFVTFVYCMNLEPRRPPIIAIVVLPVVAGVAVFVVMAFYCWLYNLLAMRIGGIAFEVTPRSDS
jgi:hypothetical protein